MENEMIEAPKTVKCLNCGHEFEGNFCPQCGQSAQTKRFTMQFLFNNLLLAILSNDGGVWFTLKNLFTRPGAMIVEILNGKRKRYFSPFPMLFLALAIYILLTSITGFGNIAQNLVFEPEVLNDEYADQANVVMQIKDMFVRSFKFYWDHYTLSTLLTLPLVVVAARLCFGKTNRKRYNWAEYCVPIVYAMVLVTMYRCITSLVHVISPDVASSFKLFTIVVFAVSITVCFIKMMDMSVLKTFWRSLLALMIYYTMIFFLIMIGIVIGALIVMSRIG